MDNSQFGTLDSALGPSTDFGKVVPVFSVTVDEIILKLKVC